MLYIIVNSFAANTAQTNRTLAMIQELDNKGVNAIVFFLYPDEHYNLLKAQFNNIEIIHLWNRLFFRNKYIYKLWKNIWIPYISYLLKDGDEVLLLGASRFVSPLTHTRKKIKVYHERTEHPSVVSLPRYLQSKYLQSCKRLDGLFVISTNLKKYFISIGVKPEKITIVNMIVNPSRFEGINKKDVPARYVAYCGTASNNKDGVDDLIRSFAYVVKEKPDVKLYIIGKTPTKSDEAGNLALIDVLNLKDKIIFTGVVEANLMPQMLKNAEVLVLNRPKSIQAQNGFPTKLGEYLLTKNPVVITSVGDIPLFLSDGVDAMISEDKNPKMFAEKILFLLNNKDIASKIGQAGEKVALNCFNSKIEVQKIIDKIYS